MNHVIFFFFSQVDDFKYYMCFWWESAKRKANCQNIFCTWSPG